MSEIAKLRAMEREATSGPWRQGPCQVSAEWVEGIAETHRSTDARLIAALRNCAPELLAVAETVDSMGLVVAPGCDPTCSACRAARALDALRAAIRRATSEGREAEEG